MTLTSYRTGRLVLIAAIGGAVVASVGHAQSLRGSRSSVELMYGRARAAGFEFFQTPDEVYKAALGGKLKMISISDDVTLKGSYYPFVLPLTFDFITKLAAQYHAQCGERLVVTSAARPMDKQPRNAVKESVHPTGMAVDFHRPVEPCLTWLRKALVVLEDQDVIEATEERHPPHFHVAVLRPSPTQYAVNIDLKGVKAQPQVVTTSRGVVVAADGAAAPAPAPCPPKATATPATQPTATPPEPSAPATSDTGGTVYRVDAGDNLWTIAQRHHTTVKRLQAANNLRTAKLRPGQQLRIP
jgi:LysM repeat protein